MNISSQDNIFTNFLDKPILNMSVSITQENDRRALEYVDVNFTQHDYQPIDVQGQKKLWKRWWFWAFGLLLAIVIIIMTTAIGASNLGSPLHNCSVENTEGIIYRLFVEDFTKQGNFEGVIDKLDYIESLGTKYIVLMQGFTHDSTQPIDFLELNEDKVGTWEQFEELSKKAGVKGMRILIELNVISTNFGSKQFPDSVLVSQEEYVKINNSYLYLGCGVPSSKKKFKCDGAINRPVINATNTEAMTTFYEILKKWLQHGACGFLLHNMQKIYSESKSEAEMTFQQNIVKKVNELIEEVSNGILIVDIGKKVTDSMKTVNMLYAAGAKMVFAFNSFSNAFNDLVFAGEFRDEHFENMDMVLKEQNILTKERKEIPFSFTRGDVIYSVPQRFKKSYPFMFLAAYTMAATPMITAWEEVGQTGLIGQKINWEEVKNITKFDFFKDLVKLRTNSMLTKVDECSIRNEEEGVLSIYRNSSTGLKFTMKINLNKEKELNVSLNCEGNYIATQNFHNTTKCDGSTVYLGYLDGIFMNITEPKSDTSQRFQDEHTTTSDVNITSIN